MHRKFECHFCDAETGRFYDVQFAPDDTITLCQHCMDTKMEKVPQSEDRPARRGVTLN